VANSAPRGTRPQRRPGHRTACRRCLPVDSEDHRCL